MNRGGHNAKYSVGETKQVRIAPYLVEVIKDISIEIDGKFLGELPKNFKLVIQVKNGRVSQIFVSENTD